METGGTGCQIGGGDKAEMRRGLRRVKVEEVRVKLGKGEEVRVVEREGS